ncbi:L-histidine N(alpha)-methyltransferase [Dyella psychrodurans]|uniref:L-histidine N(Alpha)-methyltransferase n=2 Tax=Dyella psychrodurans TaxID=1927960 RepID=A0A370WXY4_9GAMM|nr:L-histidine N(alpha)-methyltransferase [Dyella psychrodurans]
MLDTPTNDGLTEHESNRELTTPSQNDSLYGQEFGNELQTETPARLNHTSIASPTQGVHQDLLTRYNHLRDHTEELVSKLEIEDMVVQSMSDASPTAWHLAHTTWFFETFVLLPYKANYHLFDPSIAYLFNSYHETLGPRHPRARRGLITRPSVKAIMAYRQYVDAHMRELLCTERTANPKAVVELGIAHEEQHQELLLMDILHLFAQSPSKPVYDEHGDAEQSLLPSKFISIAGGLISIGTTDSDFHFDNEGPAHKVWIEPYEISDQLVTNGEWLEFMRADGYRRVELWLADGWAINQVEGWEAPMYWEHHVDGWYQMTLRGLLPIDEDAAVGHISYYEASAYALWREMRLPTEAEWEHAAKKGLLRQVDNVGWQWTQSAYHPYPGFRAADNAIGEYNGKFMVGQMVLRGGAHATPSKHTRLSYRNFYRPEQRWMFSGVRLAKDSCSLADSPEKNTTQFARDLISGLSGQPKVTSPKYFYDARGSELFEAICRTPEYYPTRTEMMLLRQSVAQIVADIPMHSVLVEFGSGASEKTRLILDAAPQLSSYIPIDVSDGALSKATIRLREDYPNLHISPLVEDFTKDIQLPLSTTGKPIVAFFPGSTIGNFTPEEACNLLVLWRERLGHLGHEVQLIIGIDMVKDEGTLLAAYDDAQGVTAEFNKNLLLRANRELAADFDIDRFYHRAIWNASEQRIEMHLVSCVDQVVTIGGYRFSFHKGEFIHTENSHKFTDGSFRRLCEQAGWSVSNHWISSPISFSIYQLRTLSPSQDK